jgi:murein DD-endopeptidase MepM/ murein hydrolase activator NlpD
VNLNSWALVWQKYQNRRHSGQNPLLNPWKCQEMLDYYYTLHGFDYSYGGYLEDRSTLWRDSYLARRKTFLHLGVDFNAPAGTPVAVDRHCQVVLLDDDIPEVGGWGTRVMFNVSHTDAVLIYAHLAKDVSCKVGDTLKPGDVFARIGTPNCNGYWYPHVHVQVMTMERYREFKKDPQGLDGYGRVEDVQKLKKEFPNPMRYVNIR